MSLHNFILTPISGAIIGYCTNWIAIKMLFRPHEEKRIFGFKLPFTPGLMPKERYRLSKKIGETVAEHILTEEVLRAELLSDEALTKINYLLKDVWNKLEQSDTTLESLIVNSGGEQEVITGILEEALLNSVQNWLNSEAMRQNLLNQIKSLVIKLLQYEYTSEMAENIIAFAKPRVSEITATYLQGEDFQDNLRSALKGFKNGLTQQERSVKEYLPRGTEEFITKLLVDYTPLLADFIQRLPSENPEVDEKFHTLVSNIIDDNIGSLASLFVNKTKVYESIKKNFSQYLSEQQNLELIINKISLFISEMLEKSISEYATKLPEEFDSEIAEAVLGFIHSHPKLVDEMFEFWLGELKDSKPVNLYSVIKKFVPEEQLHVGIDKFVEQQLLNIMDTHIIPLLKSKMPVLTKRIFTFSIGDIVRFIKKSLPEISDMDSKINKLVYHILNNASADVLRNIEIGGIVERQINSFELQKSEDIILSVVKKELRAITALGGVLGFILGLMAVVLSSYA